jgi:hypothetical protein
MRLYASAGGREDSADIVMFAFAVDGDADAEA